MPDREIVLNLVIKHLSKPRYEPASAIEKTELDLLREACNTRITNFDNHFKDAESAIKAACEYIMTHKDVFPDEARMIYNAFCDKDSQSLPIFRNADDFAAWKVKLRKSYLLVRSDRASS